MKTFFTDRYKAVLLLCIILIFMFRVCHALLSVNGSLVVTCGEKADLLARFNLKFSCVLSLPHVVSWVRRGT